MTSFVMCMGKMEYQYPDELPPHTSSSEMKDPQLKTSVCYTNVGFDPADPGLNIPGLSGSLAGEDSYSNYPMHKSLMAYGEDSRLACSRTGGGDHMINPLVFP